MLSPNATGASFQHRLAGFAGEAFPTTGRMTGNSEHNAANLTQSLIGGMEAIDHEAETVLTKKTHHHKICPAPARPRAAKAAVLNSLTSLDAQRGYRHAIDEFVDWYCSEPRLALNRIVVLRYRSHLESRQLAPGTVNLRLGAERRLAYEAADCGLLSADLAAGIRRVKGVKKLGVRLGNWLTAEQDQALWQAADHQRLKGKRDRALLALLLACGLRRHEAVALRLDHLQQREEHWAIVDLIGKGGHVRTVPVPDWVRTELHDLVAAAGIDRGKLFRRVSKVGKAWGNGMTVKAVW